MGRKKKRQKDPWKERAENLRILGFECYADYLDSPLWGEIRRRKFAAPNGRLCSFCSAPATQVHHDSYDLKTLAGKKLVALATVCDDCHEYGSVREDGTVRWPYAARAAMIKRARSLGLGPPERPKKKRRKYKPHKVDPSRARWVKEYERALADLKARQQAFRRPRPQRPLKGRRITRRLIERGKSERGGWTRAQLEVLGVPWPPPKGWKESAIGRPFSATKAKKFLALRG